MPNIIVRRRPATTAGTVTDVVFAVGDQDRVETRLRDMLTVAQRERGQAPWSDADPEVWIGSTLVARLPPDGDIDELVERTMGRFRGELGAAALPKHRLDVAAINALPERSVRSSTGVFVLFRRSQGGDPPLSMRDGYTCLKVAPTRGQNLEDALRVELDIAPRTGTTHFSVVVTNLDVLTEHEHRRLYEAFQPLNGEQPAGA